MTTARWWFAAISAASLLAVGTSACVERPTASQCEAMAEHMVELIRGAQSGRGAELAAEVAGEHHAELVATCTTEGTLAEVRCVLATTELAGLSSCAPRG